MAKANRRYWPVVVLIGLAAFGTAQAQQPQPPAAPPPPAHPAIEPAALAMLKAASERLAGAKSMSFTAVTTYESPARNGQPLYYTTLSNVLLARPDELRVITPGDGPASEFYYDGKTMTAYAPAANLVAIAAAPPSVDAMLRVSFEKAAIYFPFGEVVVSDPYRNLSQGLTSAFVVGQSMVVGGTITDMVAIANANVQAEIWIGIKDGLPRMIRAIYPKDPGKSRYEIEFSNWRLDPPVTPADFASARAAAAPRMDFARPDALPAAKP
jgi:hypothetical protein